MTSQLVDLQSFGDDRFAQVFAPAEDRDRVATGVTKQFLEDAETYHAKYFDIGYSKYLIDSALQSTAPAVEMDLILDIGSGSGPSVFALMDRFPTSHVVATDVSPNLLAILRSALKKADKTERCTTLCLDLNRPWFKGTPFSIAVGSAILHHLFEPHLLLKHVFDTIRPGGAAFFFEPFEPGYAMMAMIYRLLIAMDEQQESLHPSIRAFFEGKIAQIAEMKCEPKDPAMYASIDDKWMFTRNHFEKIGTELGASKTIVFPINHSDKPFTGNLVTQLRLGLGLSPEHLPDWAWSKVAEIEHSMSDACKRDLLLEGCVAFVR